MAPTAVRDFFAPTVQRVVGPFMNAREFSLDTNSEHRVTYSRGDSIVSFAYYVEDLPSPWVAIDVGRRGLNGDDRVVPLWRSIPESDAARGYTRWQFTDQPGLEGVLARVVNELLPSHARRLWEDDSSFGRVLAGQDAETQADYCRMQDRAALRAARRAFDEGDFQTALDKYALLGAEVLPAEDRRRIHRARAALGQRDLGPRS